MGAARKLDSSFAALADPTRRAILVRLAGGEATVNQIAAKLPISQPAVSRHLRLLEEAGLVESRVDGNRRPRRLSAQGLTSVDAFLDKLRAAMEANYSRLDALLASGAADSPSVKRKKR